MQYFSCCQFHYQRWNKSLTPGQRWGMANRANFSTSVPGTFIGTAEATFLQWGSQGLCQENPTGSACCPCRHGWTKIQFFVQWQRIMDHTKRLFNRAHCMKEHNALIHTLFMFRFPGTMLHASDILLFCLLLPQMILSNSRYKAPNTQESHCEL